MNKKILETAIELLNGLVLVPGKSEYGKSLNELELDYSYVINHDKTCTLWLNLSSNNPINGNFENIKLNLISNKSSKNFSISLKNGLIIYNGITGKYTIEAEIEEQLEKIA